VNTPNVSGRSKSINDNRLPAVFEIRERLQAGDAALKYSNVPRQDTAFVQSAKNVNAKPIIPKQQVPKANYVLHQT
jgi:hypothetical protein